MKYNYSRRHFICQTSLLSAGLTLCSSNVVSALDVSSNNNINTNIFRGLVDIRTTFFKGKSLRITGVVYNKLTLQPLRNAKLKIYHGNNLNNKTSHKALLKTRDDGGFEILTDFPHNHFGKSARLFFKVYHQGANAPIELVITKNGAHIMSSYWESCTGLDSELIPKMCSSFFSNHISFNLFV